MKSEPNWSVLRLQWRIYAFLIFRISDVVWTPDYAQCWDNETARFSSPKLSVTPLSASAPLYWWNNLHGGKKATKWITESCVNTPWVHIVPEHRCPTKAWCTNLQNTKVCVSFTFFVFSFSCTLERRSCRRKDGWLPDFAVHLWFTSFTHRAPPGTDTMTAWHSV